MDRQIKQAYFLAPPFPITVLTGKRLRKDPRRIHVYFAAPCTQPFESYSQRCDGGMGPSPVSLFKISRLFCRHRYPEKYKVRESDNTKRRRNIKLCDLLRPNGTRNKSCVFPTCFNSYPTRSLSVPALDHIEFKMSHHPSKMNNYCTPQAEHTPPKLLSKSQIEHGVNLAMCSKHLFWKFHEVLIGRSLAAQNTLGTEGDVAQSRPGKSQQVQGQTLQHSLPHTWQN